VVKISSSVSTQAAVFRRPGDVMATATAEMKTSQTNSTAVSHSFSYCLATAFITLPRMQRVLADFRFSTAYNNGDGSSTVTLRSVI